jgi:hypothetical protein
MAHGINDAQQGRLADHFSLQLTFSWEIYERDPNQHRQQALSRQKNHGKAGQQKHDADDVLDNQPREAQHWMMVFHPMAGSTRVKIVGRQANQNQRNGNQGTDKSDSRSHGETDEHIDRNPLLDCCEYVIHAPCILACDLKALKPTTAPRRVFTARFSTGYTLSMARRSLFTVLISTLLGAAVLGVGLLTIFSSVCASDDLHIEMKKKGLGKEVVITQGAREWFMLIEVTPENSVVLRQEKDHDIYLVDESETHDRPMTTGEVDAAITDYVNSVKTRAIKE